MTALAPTCNFRCPEKKGTCFPDPCKLYRPPSAEASARWRLEQCRKTVREGEAELVKRREALRQAEIALVQLTEDGSHTGGEPREDAQRRATTNSPTITIPPGGKP